MGKGEAEQIRAALVKCEDCGATFSDYAWSPDASCPKCHSNRFAPVPVMGGRSDYDTADRSQGFAIEDVRFGRLAQWAGMLSPKQVQRALYRQRDIARGGREPPDLGTLLVKDKVLTKQQRDAVIAGRRSLPGSTGDAEFARAALRNGYVTQEQIDACQKIQKEAATRGRDAPPLPLLLYEKRFTRERHVMALLEAAALQLSLIHI